MNSILKMISILILGLSTAWLSGCPACVGRLEESTPPFFTEEYDAHCRSNSIQPTQSTAANSLEENKKKEKES